MIALPRLLAVMLAISVAGCSPAASPPVANDSPAVTVTATKPTSMVAAAPAPLKLLTAEEIEEGWISLFDGQTTFGWKAESKADWEVKEGVLSVSAGDPGLLCTTVPFDNYQLKLDFRAGAATNSGIFLRTAPVVGKDDLLTKCYELNIAGSDNPFPTGSLVGRVKAKEVPASTEWQSFDVTVNGPQVTVKLNGDEVATYEDPQPIGSGLIGLQLNSGKVEFRNIKLKPLALDSLFNGKDLTGWKEPEMNVSKFTVTEQGWLNVKNGRGYLESEKSYGDFVLQLQCISNAPSLNSGIFFRSIPGENMNGYESQIHNGIKNGDPTQPVDCGTGGIFRRINARRVMAEDGQWFSKTIIAAGPHVSVWVNGYQVTDWTDERPANDNPRNGLRTAAGTLQIQGHDPTTDLSFRNLFAREIAKR